MSKILTEAEFDKGLEARLIAQIEVDLTKRVITNTEFNDNLRSIIQGWRTGVGSSQEVEEILHIAFQRLAGRDSLDVFKEE